MEQNRTNLLHTDEIDSRIKAIRKAMDEIKNPQYIGSDSVRFYKKDSGNPFDWSGVPPQSPQASWVSTKILRVTATALTQNVLFADLIPELRVNSNSNPRHTVIDYYNELEAFVNDFSILHYPDAQLPGNENKLSWTVVITANNPNTGTRPLNTLFMKAYVVANDDVSINVVSLN